MIRAALELVGKPLFSNAALADHLEKQVQALVASEHQRQAPTDRKFSKLKLRRRLAEARLPEPVSIVTSAAIGIVGGRDDGRVVAEHRSVVEGEPALLALAPAWSMPGRRPVAMIAGGELIVTVLFHPADWAFVSPLVRAELDLIEAGLAMQREAIARFRAGYADLVRRLVAAQWTVPLSAAR